MRTKHRLVVFDAADLGAESRFWAALLEGEVVRADDDWHQVEVDGDPAVAVQLKTDHVPPDWPDGSPPQQVHLDLEVDGDVAAAEADALAAGARLLQPAHELGAREGFRVYADPAGHPFCLTWG